MLKLVTDEDLKYNLDEIVRLGAKKMLMEALQAEVDDFIQSNKDKVDESGRRLIVRNGKAQPRSLTLSSGTVEIQAPRANDRRQGQRFTSTILPPYLRKSPKIESLIPALYLKGLSTGKIGEVVQKFFGKGSMGLSPATVSKLVRVWEEDFKLFKEKKLHKRYVYIWADGVHVNVRLGDDKKICLLVLIGVTETGEKELLAVEAGYRESREGWLSILRSLVDRGLRAPLVAIGDGALGFWSALRELEEFKNTQEQRCWVHKIKNVLNKLPKRVQAEAKSLLHEMMSAPDKNSADKARNTFNVVFGAKYPKAVECLSKDWVRLITFFNFPAEHWVSLRTTNPIESAFATVKLRTKTTKGAGSRSMAATMAFKLLLECQKKWRSIRGSKEIKKLLSGVEYKDGVMVNNENQSQEAAAM